MKALFYGDNLQVLRDSIATESVDLIYLDPPFSSNATYNVGCQGQGGRDRMRGRTAACSQIWTLAVRQITPQGDTYLSAVGVVHRNISVHWRGRIKLD